MSTDPYLFSFISKDHLHDVIRTFQSCTGLTTQVIDENGNILYAAGEESAFCTEFRKHLTAEDSCEKIHIGASRKAIALGESYIFSCHAGLNHIAFPLIRKNALYGSVIVGPFIMEEADASLILDIHKRYQLPVSSLLQLSENANALKVISPSQVYDISKLLYHLMSGMLAESKRMLDDNHGKLLQQSKIHEAVQMYKTSGYKEEQHYPYEKERLLINKVKLKDMPAAKAVLNDLLGHLFLFEGHNIKRIRNRVIELSTVLSRAAIDSGAETDKVMQLNDALIEALSETDDFYDLCYLFQENVEIFTESLFYSASSNSELIKSAANYIAQNFSREITLEEVAAQVHLNASYLSSLFKQVTGTTFKEYLNQVRIEESKLLLLHTDYSVLDIAIACGFNDQSYFTKVFKRLTGMTPSQYR